MEKKEEIRRRRHEAYIRRKESGWQAMYDAKNRAKKKQHMDGMKEELRREDIAKGIFIPVMTLPVTEPKKGVAI